MPKREPDFFILGAPKCGTTSLAFWLQQHPNVFVPEVKEPQHYNTDFNIDTPLRERSRYLDLFAGAGPQHSRVGEATTWYLYSSAAVPNILAEKPNAQFVVMLRNPVDMAASLHRQVLFNGVETEPDFARAWALQEERRRGRCVPAFCHDVKALLYADACALGTQLARLLARVPAEQVHTILLDDVRADARGVWQQLLRFLDLPDDDRQTFPVLNTAKQRRSQHAQAVTNAYLALRRKFGLPPLGTGFFTRLDRWNVQRPEKSGMPAELRAEIRAHFTPEIDRLEALLDRDLRDWKSDGG